MRRKQKYLLLQTGPMGLLQVSQEQGQLAVPALKQDLGSCHWQEAGPWTWAEQRAASSTQEQSATAFSSPI